MGQVVEMGSVLKRTLKSLCCSNGWSYAVFWGFDQRNSMLLTLEDAYYEEEMAAALVDNMLLQFHMMGEGIIGQVAFTGKHKWMFSDVHCGEWNAIGSIGTQVLFQDDSDIRYQFSSGIQTIAVISLESRGVVQFGSTQKISESSEFLNQTKGLLQEMENLDGINQLESTPVPSYDLSTVFASLISSANSSNANLTPVRCDNSRELIGSPCSLANLTQSSTFISEIDHRRITPLHTDSSNLCNQLQTAYKEAKVTITPCISTWSNEGSILTSFEQPFPSESVVQNSPNMYSTKANTPVQNFQDSTFSSMYSVEGLVDMEKSTPVRSGKMNDNQYSAQSFFGTECELSEIATNLHRFPDDLFKLDDFATNLSSSYAVDDLSQWFTASPDHSINQMVTTLNNNLLPSTGATSVSSGMVEGEFSTEIPIKHPSNSMQSSISDAFMSDGLEKFGVVQGMENDLFDDLGVEFGFGRAGECWEDYMKPVTSNDQSAINTGISECITQLDVGSTAGPRKGLFSELGLEELLSGLSSSSSITRCNNLEDQFSTTKRRKMEGSSSNSNQVQLTKPVYNQEINNLVCKKDVLLKSQVGLWIDDIYGINADNVAVAATPQKPEKPTKVSKKRARPGESTRPRPKDRQQIQDRLKELRGIIPNGVKCSIDSLLDLTIKHMLFLQSITKNADKLKEAEEPKLIGRENGVVLKDNSTGGHNNGGGVTWAYEVGGQTMVCPIIVEDLNPPGQMLIEMLCEDRGFFLEIADIIKGFGLNIWKGVMEIREDKIWARFIVEANRHVTRMDIFWSLVQLLQQTATSGTDSTHQPNNDIDSRIPPLDSYQQHMLHTQLPISVAETLQ
ncbi:hypothetical protein QYF36_000049 [Acer negundo]|nr:hypothetical protein QYF36_000049 [Acer negundo]